MSRAGSRCECRGECGDDHSNAKTARPAGRCLAPHGTAIVRNVATPSYWLDAESWLANGFGCSEGADDWAKKAVIVVLTIAHLDQQPENSEPSNLRALCQRCHLRYDHAQHVGNARKTRHARKAHRELF